MKKQRAASKNNRSVGVRLDKWLWAARFFKTRALSAEAIEKGRVLVNGQSSKAGKDARIGDMVRIKTGPVEQTVMIRALSGVRGPASVATLLYEETETSIERRLHEATMRRMTPEPAHSIVQGRPTKRDRRSLSAIKHEPQGNSSTKGWDDRWSASWED